MAKENRAVWSYDMALETHQFNPVCLVRSEGA